MTIILLLGLLGFFILRRKKHGKSWLVQLAIGAQINVCDIVEKFLLEMDVLFTWENLNVLTLYSYDVLIVMDWLEENQVKIDYCNNKN